MYSNVLILRVRMPISDDLSPRNFVTKISKYERVVNIPNSMSVLYDLLPVSIEMTLHDCRGVFNFTNPGAISHNEILDLYKKYIDPSFTYTNFTLEEQAKILAAGRSNNELDSSKLVETCRQFGVEIPPIKESIVHVFERMQKNLGIELWGVCSNHNCDQQTEIEQVQNLPLVLQVTRLSHPHFVVLAAVHVQRGSVQQVLLLLLVSAVHHRRHRVVLRRVDLPLTPPPRPHLPDDHQLLRRRHQQ